MGLARALVEIVDRRDAGGHLRVTWHPAKRLINVSQWRHGVCVATTPVELSDVPELVSLLVGALEEAAAMPPEQPAAEPTLSTLRQDARTVLTSRARALVSGRARTLPSILRRRAGHLAQIVDIHSRADRPGPHPEDEPGRSE
jgi:hypothetical protein